MLYDRCVDGIDHNTKQGTFTRFKFPAFLAFIKKMIASFFLVLHAVQFSRLLDALAIFRIDLLAAVFIRR